ncbi:MAG TPA: hypothetical protein PLY87_09745, partial [Planctomycetaceae bacterium]|nr:hypothetical protein [Planctomycetaceae bacterium]
ASKVSSVTSATLREKRRSGSLLTINEWVLVYRRHSHQYYQKYGAVTREATIIDDVLRFLRKYHATMFLEDFGPVVVWDLQVVGNFHIVRA